MKGVSAGLLEEGCEVGGELLVDPQTFSGSPLEGLEVAGELLAGPWTPSETDCSERHLTSCPLFLALQSQDVQVRSCIARSRHALETET